MGSEKSEASQNSKKKHKIPSWAGPIFFAELVHLVLPALFGVVTTLLFLFKAGVLQLAHWPIAAFIVLVVIEVILIAAFFAFGLIYMWLLILHGIPSLFSRWGNTEEPKWSRWSLPFDYLAIATLVVLNKIIEWRDRDTSRTRHRKV